MARLDHVALGVSDLAAVRDWYTSVLGLQVEFDTPTAVGLTDDGDVTLILAADPAAPTRCSLYFQVDDVAATHAALVARGIVFRYPPQANDWGYGAGLSDPDGRLVGLWDQASMARPPAGRSGP